MTAAVLSTAATYGCYVYEPTTASLLAPGKSVALDLNDLGRLNLASLIGPEVRRVSGVLVSQSNNSYVLHVNQLGFFNGRTSEWSGEALTIRTDYVTSVLEERLSTSRTALAVAGSVAAVGAIVATHSLNGSGNTGGDTKPTPPVNSYRGIQ